MSIFSDCSDKFYYVKKTFAVFLCVSEYFSIGYKYVCFQCRKYKAKSPHFSNAFDLHIYCPTCREARKGDNCVLGLSGEMQIWEKPEDRSYVTLLSSLHHYSTFSLCKRAKTSSLKRVPLNYKGKSQALSELSLFVAPREAEVAIENAPMKSLPLVVQHPSPQAQEASVVEATGGQSRPHHRAGGRGNPTK